MLNKSHDAEFLLGKLLGNPCGILVDLFWAKPQMLFIARSVLNSQTVTALFSSGANHVSAVWRPHPGAKTRGSFSLTASSAQCSFHTVLLLGDFYKNSQSLILSLC
jgi:hypothetical protein